jgi:uncharacterized membrane protein YedE/YeeE
MTRPEKIVGFLDFFGAWDPTLAFVMGGALAVHVVGYRLVRRREKPLYDVQFDVPEGGRPDFPLLAGSALFGVGWGLGGFCPGPAVVALVSLDARPVVFFVAMLAGMALYKATRPVSSVSPAEESCG